MKKNFVLNILLLVTLLLASCAAPEIEPDASLDVPAIEDGAPALAEVEADPTATPDPTNTAEPTGEPSPTDEPTATADPAPAPTDTLETDDEDDAADDDVEEDEGMDESAEDGEDSAETETETETDTDTNTEPPADEDTTMNETDNSDDGVNEVVASAGTVNMSEVTPDPPAEEDKNPRVMPAPGTPNQVPPQLETLIEQIYADAAERTQAPREQITVGYVEQVTWPDGSLGCPQPGSMYTMALVDGFRVVLDVNGKEYFYHTDSGNTFIFCDKIVGGNILQPGQPGSPSTTEDQ